MNWPRFGLVAAILIGASACLAQAQDKADKGKAEKAEKSEKPEKDKTEKAVASSSYYPLEIGNVWHYKLDNMKFTMKVTKFEPVDKIMCARIELVVDNKAQAFEHIAVKTDGIYRYTYEGKKTDPPACILKLPPKSGDMWEINAKVGGESLKGTLKEGEAEVKVPAGTYKTVTVAADDFDANGTKITFKYFFAENVGMVKQELNVNGQAAIIELEKFEPGKK
jgi:hypothetical protein